MDWLDEVNNVPEKDYLFYNIKSHNLPIMMYGAGINAEIVTNQLSSHGIYVDQYCVDSQYYTREEFLGKPVRNFSTMEESEKQKYVFVLGISPFANKKSAMQFENENFIKYIIPSPPFFGIPEEITKEYINQNKSAFNETYHWLEDEKSKQTFIAYLKMKISGDYKWNKNICENGFQYFTDIVSGFQNIFVDCGAWQGDTIRDFMEWSKGEYENIYAVEADKRNFVLLKEFCKKKKYKNINFINKGVYDCRKIISFSTGTDGTGSSIVMTGNEQIFVEPIDEILQGKMVSYIKMDIEGSELPALHGAQETISKYMPALAICVYHRANDLMDIPQFIKKFESKNKKYKLYLRKYHPLSSTTELVLYAVPFSCH